MVPAGPCAGSTPSPATCQAAKFKQGLKRKLGKRARAFCEAGCERRIPFRVTWASEIHCLWLTSLEFNGSHWTTR